MDRQLFLELEVLVSFALLDCEWSLTSEGKQFGAALASRALSTLSCRPPKLDTIRSLPSVDETIKTRCFICFRNMDEARYSYLLQVKNVMALKQCYEGHPRLVINILPYILVWNVASLMNQTLWFSSGKS